MLQTTVWMMENKAAELKETLVQISMDSCKTTLKPEGPPAPRPLSHVAVPLTVMGLIILALAAGLTCLMLRDPHPQSDKVNVTVTHRDLKEGGKYDIFTVKKGSTYLIYGWISAALGTREIELLQTRDKKEGPLQTITPQANEKVIFFYDTAKLVNDVTISVRSQSNIYILSVHILEYKP